MVEILKFLPVPPDTSLIYEGSYNPIWVIISVLLAILASYAALSAASRIGQLSNTTARLTWALISAFTLGVGIWAMHFIGMLALSLPCGIKYDPLITLISMAPAILASGAALGVGWYGGDRLSTGCRSVLLGAGIGTMHYMGMAAMRLDGFVRYDPTLFAVSIFVAVALSYLALRVKSGVARLKKRHDVLVAIIMGSATSGMHYTGMSAAYFVKGDVAALPASIFTTNTLALTVAITTVLLTLGALALATFSRNREITDQLRDSEERLKFAMEGAGDGMWDWNPQTDKAVFSKRWKEMLGYAEEEFPDIGAAWLEHLHPDDKGHTLSTFEAYFADQQTYFATEYRMRCKDDSWKWILGRGKLVSRDANGKPSRMIGTHTDITERKASEARIKYLTHVYIMLSGINSLIVRVTVRDELFRETCRIAIEAGEFRMAVVFMVDPHTNKIVLAATAGKDEELLAGIKDLLVSREDSSKTMVARAIREKLPVVSNDSPHDPQVLLRKEYAESGVRSMALFPLIVSGEAVGALALYAGEIEFFHEEEMKLLTELAGDIAFAMDHLDKQEKLNYLAYYDALTGLANRNLFLERVAQHMRSAVSSGHKLALCLIDLERFKNINDSLGRPVGDALLRQVAVWLTNNSGDASLLARIDADHFAMLLPEIKQEADLVNLIEKMGHAFQEHPFRLNDSVFRIATKAGIALFPDDGDNADTLFKNAEAALKKTKISGDRYLFYTQKMTEAVAGKLVLENQLRRAIDNEEFVLYYQPKVNLASGKVTSAEALIRWNDPRTGLVPPGKFIPILEETGLINEVGRWALHKAITDSLRWRRAGLPAVRVAVNVSALQLHRHGFITELEQAIAIDEYAAQGLELEITESMIMVDIEHNIASLEAIRSMGISIAIDDFGTGFSSLSYLAKLPVDTLKIDRSFVIDMAPGSGGLALVTTIINLAHALKLKVVAEGVETEEQARQLGLLGCDEMQGYLFSKPVPADIFETKFLVW